MLSMSFIFAEYCFREIQCTHNVQTQQKLAVCVISHIAFPILPVVKEWLDGRCWLVTSGLCSSHTQNGAVRKAIYQWHYQQVPLPGHCLALEMEGIIITNLLVPLSADYTIRLPFLTMNMVLVTCIPWLAVKCANSSHVVKYVNQSL